MDLALLPAGDRGGSRRERRPELCPRFSALVFENITVAPSPLWLQFRLSALGLNPISNIVDLTNYIMSELAQPMHAYDRALLQGWHVDRTPGARGRTRDWPSITRSMRSTPANLVIADGKRARWDLRV